MINEKLTIKQAAKKWVSEFNRIPMALIEKAYEKNGWEEIEALAAEKECGECGNTEFEEVNHSEGYCKECEKIVDAYSTYAMPMWGTMWTFGDSLDDEWIADPKNLEKARQCGIWVYESNELGVFFGIDGAGYDFYESHWIPLYEARGLKWHAEETQEVE